VLACESNSTGADAVLSRRRLHSVGTMETVVIQFGVGSWPEVGSGPFLNEKCLSCLLQPDSLHPDFLQRLWHYINFLIIYLLSVIISGLMSHYINCSDIKTKTKIVVFHLRERELKF